MIVWLLPPCLTRRLAGSFLLHSKPQETWELPSDKHSKYHIQCEFSATTEDTFIVKMTMKRDNLPLFHNNHWITMLLPIYPSSFHCYNPKHFDTLLLKPKDPCQ